MFGETDTLYCGKKMVHRHSQGEIKGLSVYLVCSFRPSFRFSTEIKTARCKTITSFFNPIFQPGGAIFHGDQKRIKSRGE